MANRGAAAALNAVLWGSGSVYSGRGAGGLLAALAHVTLYLWLPILGLTNWLLVMGPIFLLGSLYFARDAYKYAYPTVSRQRINTKADDGKSKQKGTCINCGAPLSATAKFCPECGATQAG